MIGGSGENKLQILKLSELATLQSDVITGAATAVTGTAVGSNHMIASRLWRLSLRGTVARSPHPPHALGRGSLGKICYQE